jgi:class 3 adenylate cyclase
MIDRNADTPEDARIRFRMGVNLGDVIVEPEDIFGDGVNIAARLEALAEPGGICVTRVVRDQVRDSLTFRSRTWVSGRSRTLLARCTCIVFDLLPRPQPRLPEGQT